jgi:spermidine synthase
MRPGIFVRMRRWAARWSSYLWPVHERTVQGLLGPIEITWVNGELIVHTETADQSYGSLHRVWRSAFRDAGILSLPANSQVLVLGFGAGSIATLLHGEHKLPVHIVGVEHDPAMLAIAREHFGIVPSGRLELVVADARAFLDRLVAPFGLVCVDLFHGSDLAPGIDEPEFIGLLKRSVAPGGRLIVNTIQHDAQSTRRSERVARELRLAFDAVGTQRYEGNNMVYICR